MGGFGMGGFGALFWLLLIVAGTRAVTAARTADRSADTARRILDERLSRGDPSIEEHRKRRAEL